MEEKISCPLGSKCEEIKKGELHRCAWHTMVNGVDQNTGEKTNKWACAMAWLPMLLTHVAGTNQGQTAAIESLRNEVARQSNATVVSALLENERKRLIDGL